MENKHVSEGLSDWEQIQSPLPVFPPGNHENLPVTNPPDDSDHQFQEQELIDLLSPSTNGDGERRWKRLRLDDLQNGIFRFAGYIKKYATRKIGLVSFAAWSAFGIVGLVMAYFLHRRVLMWWQRRMHIESSKDSLTMNLIREKDEKINELLLQIAQMNEILLARRRVPVIRVK